MNSNNNVSRVMDFDISSFDNSGVPPKVEPPKTEEPSIANFDDVFGSNTQETTKETKTPVIEPTTDNINVEEVSPANEVNFEPTAAANTDSPTISTDVPPLTPDINQVSEVSDNAITFDNGVSTNQTDLPKVSSGISLSDALSSPVNSSINPEPTITVEEVNPTTTENNGEITIEPTNAAIPNPIDIPQPELTNEPSPSTNVNNFTDNSQANVNPMPTSQVTGTVVTGSADVVSIPNSEAQVGLPNVDNTANNLNSSTVVNTSNDTTIGTINNATSAPAADTSTKKKSKLTLPIIMLILIIVVSVAIIIYRRLFIVEFIKQVINL